MKLFEYYSQIMHPAEGDEFKSQLDAMGSLGWELVNIVEERGRNVAIFKRELPSKQEKQLLLEEDGMRISLPEGFGDGDLSDVMPK